MFHVQFHRTMQQYCHYFTLCTLQNLLSFPKVHHSAHTSKRCIHWRLFCCCSFPVDALAQISTPQLDNRCRFHCHSHCQALIIGATLATFDQPVYYANAPRDPSPIRSELTRWLTTVRRSSASGPGVNIAAATAKYQSVSWSNTTSRLGLRTPTCTLDWFWIYN